MLHIWRFATLNTKFICICIMTNGLRQGGILLPMLLNVFMDDLSILLNQNAYGYHINNLCCNHLVYLNDTVLLVTSPVALQRLIDIRTKYYCNHSLHINTSKSKVMVVLPAILKDCMFQISC